VEVSSKVFRWIGSALKDLSALPEDVKRVMGYALRLAQHGEQHPDAKPLKGFGGGSVLEVVEDHEGDT
jgi:phage-related protein